ncbi:MAG: tRNA (N(6)-L-threonylcarbamoyladenosine(37)-C(2))-methylthiotransferase MtaB, partial [Oscillibacter sp.]
MRVAIYTLGCKVNQYETQAMEQLLRSRGHTVVDGSETAEAYVVNTCSVTAVSDQKSRQAIH